MSQESRGKMKVVSKLEDDFSICIHYFAKLLLDRILATQKGTLFNLSQYKNKEVQNSLDRILQVDKAFSFEEKWVLMLAILPYFRPGFFEEIMIQALPQGGEFIPFGGIKGQQHRGMISTGETALFLLGGLDIKERLEYQKMFNNNGLFATYGLVQVESVPKGEPPMSGRLIPDADWLENILLGLEAAPVYSVDFPARKISTKMLWKDLVLHPQTREQIDDIEIWMSHHEKVLKDPHFGRRIKPGYRVLFYGKPGTGKTLTASLIGERFKIPVYRIDLSLVISKYIGETEKHLELVFARAERKNWILFFDEADALFGKRVATQSFNDRSANQEISYLLQRIEEFEGLLILASNFKNNIDDAFLRRFHNIVHFPKPGVSERLKLWEQSCPSNLDSSEIDWAEIAEKYEITGAEIINIMYYAALKTYAKKNTSFSMNDIINGIRKELKKQDKTFPA